MADSESAPLVLRNLLLDGASAVVTGAGTGIGRAIALRLVALGAHVTGMGRREDALTETRQLADDFPGQFEYAMCDVRDLDAARRPFPR